MAVSKYLNGLSPSQTDELRQTLWETQVHKCFICEQPIVLDVQGSQVDIDHINPSALSGKDDPSNFALTHASCNRSKQDNNLRVARVLARFDRLASEAQKTHSRGANLADLLTDAGGAKF